MLNQALITNIQRAYDAAIIRVIVTLVFFHVFLWGAHEIIGFITFNIMEGMKNLMGL